jgi:H+/Cl- antiporter ClcA
MLANNLFRTIGDLFTDGLFVPLNSLREIDSWWGSNILNFLFIGIFFVLLAYWMKESIRFKKEGTEDLPK